MNQIMLVGKGVVYAVERRLTAEDAHRLVEVWKDHFSDVPIIIIPDCQIVVRDNQPILFEFTGDITPTFVAEFQKWWEERVRDR